MASASERSDAGELLTRSTDVAVTDTCTRYVYTVVALIGLCLGLAFGWQVHHVDWWTGLARAAGGFGSFGALYMFGLLLARVRYGGRVEPMARGDIGIAAMVGAGAAACTAQAPVLGVFISGLLAVGFLIARRSGRASMPARARHTHLIEGGSDLAAAPHWAVAELVGGVDDNLAAKVTRLAQRLGENRPGHGNHPRNLPTQWGYGFPDIHLLRQ